MFFVKFVVLDCDELFILLCVVSYKKYFIVLKDCRMVRINGLWMDGIY